MEFTHQPVLLEACIQGLRIRPEGLYLDGTLGRAGHSREIAKRLTTGRLICIDRDQDAINAAEERLGPWRERVTLVHGNFAGLREILENLNLGPLNGMLFDLGVSSPQLDDAFRGFSYKKDAPLDMRMDREQTVSAKDIVNTYPEAELFRIIREYGEERYARSIAANIVRARENKSIETTFQLVDIIRRSMPAKARNGKGHPAKRTFQALRIECNHELEVLREVLDEMVDLLNDHGRLCIITFHSLEDRIVKVSYRRNENPCTCPPDFPVCVCGKKSRGKVITKKPVLPSEREQKENSRSQSAKMRVFERSGT